VVVVACNDVAKWCYVPTIIMTFVFIYACGAAITGLGLAMGTWCGRVGRAVALTVSLYVLVTVGWLFAASMWFRVGPENEGPMMGSPFFFAGELAADMCSPGGRTHIDWAVFWTVAYVLAAGALLGAVLATFNRCLGRVESGLVRPRRGTWKAAKAEKFVEIMGEAFDPA
jgi:hypothetical protein